MLTTSDLKYYVDTNLQGFVMNIITGLNEIHTLVGIDRDFIYTDRSGGISFDKFKPIMRKLCNLIEPIIDTDNNPLMPIVELAKLGEKQHFKYPINFIGNIPIPENKFNWMSGNNYCCSWVRDDGKSHKFFYNVNTSSFVSNVSGVHDINIIAINQEKLFKNLYNWNFWTGDQNLFDTCVIYDINKI